MSIRGRLWSTTAVTFMVVTALAVAACGTSDLSAEEEEEEYFEEVRAARALTTSKFDNFSEIFGQAWPLRSLLIDALLEAGVGTAFTGTLQVLEELTPPERFRADHERMVETVRESVRVDGEIAQAVKDDDLARFVLLNGELGDVNSSVAPGFSAAFCKNAFDPDEAALCGPAGPVPGGEYGASVHDALRRFEPAIMTLGGVVGFPLTLRPEELAKVLATQAPIFGKHLQEVRAQVESLSPPEDLRADHDRLVAYYDGISDGVSKMTAAVEAGDVETAQGQLMGFRFQFCETRGSFSSSQFKELVGLHFRADPDACDGAPF